MKRSRRREDASESGAGRRNWTPAETILAYWLLRREGGHPPTALVTKLANLVRRTTGAVRRKLQNLRSAETQGREGLPHRSRLDDRIAGEFFHDASKLARAARHAETELRELQRAEQTPQRASS